jgi:hypothetical protein
MNFNKVLRNFYSEKEKNSQDSISYLMMSYLEYCLKLVEILNAYSHILENCLKISIEYHLMEMKS